MNGKLKKSLLLFIRVAIGTMVFQFIIVAQEIRFKHLSIENGLSQSVVNCILQDRRGFLWFGTQDGLNLFDGYRFTVYRHDPSDTGSLSDNSIRTLFEDRSGRLWVGTQDGGLNLYNSETNSFSVFKNDPGNPASLSNNRVMAICEDRSGVLWVGTYGGLNLYDPKSNSFRIIKNYPQGPATLANNTVLSIYEDRSGRMWIGTQDGGLNLYDSKTESFRVFKNDPQDPASLSNNTVLSINEDRSGKMWIGTQGGGLNFYEPKTNVFQIFKNDQKNPASLSNDYVLFVHEDRSGRLWVGTDGGGLNLYHAKTNTFQTFTTNPNDPTSLSGNSVPSIYEDRTGALWVGTIGGGLNFYHENTKAFRVFRNDPMDPSSLSNSTVMCIYKDRSDRLWVGTYGGGLNLYDAEKKSFDAFKTDGKDPSTLPHNSVYTVYEDRSGRLWIGTNGGLSLYEHKTKAFKTFINDLGNPLSLSDDRVRTILEDRSGRLWIGTYGGGLNLYDTKTNVFRGFKYDPKDPASLSNNYVLCVYEDRAGQLWVGTLGGGLNVYDEKTNAFTAFKNNSKDAASLSNNNVLCLFEDRSGRLWVGTDGGGLNLFDAKRKTFRIFRESQGLPNDVVYGILEDAHGRLWLSTNKGLSRFDPMSEKFTNYDDTDGLQSNEFDKGAYFKDETGWMYFGGINGLNLFHPDSIKDDPFKPPVVLTSIELFNKQIDAGKEYNGFVLPVSITEAEELILSYKESVFTLEFSALSFALSNKNKYAYRLEGFDENWNYTDAARRFATYTNLDPGSYTFRVKASNHDGIWNEEGRTLVIVITPPWWKTWWAYSFYGLSSVFLITALIQTRIRDERKRQELKKAHELAAINKDLQEAIKKLRETQAELVQKEKMASLGQMTAGIAHEINNPLAFVHGNLEYFKHGFEKILHSFYAWQASADDEARKAELDFLTHEMSQFGEGMTDQMNTALTGSRRIKEIVENLRKFARVGEAGARETNVNADLEAIIDLFVKQHTGICIDRQFSGSLYLVGNVSELNQCYLNILTNAVQAIRESVKQGKLKTEEGVISIHTELVNMDRQKNIRLKFSDNGIGIPEENKSKIFDPFFTTRAIGQGRGLGLAEAYGIIHKHGGTIEVQSEVNKGSSFIITLPQDGVA